MKTGLLKEIKDILDELNMLVHVCKQQLGVFSSLKRALKNLVENASPDINIGLAPIKFKDCIGRRFNFPFDMCKDWAVSDWQPLPQSSS